jgi:hypothetical protein
VAGIERVKNAKRLYIRKILPQDKLNNGFFFFIIKEIHNGKETNERKNAHEGYAYEG